MANLEKMALENDNPSLSQHSQDTLEPVSGDKGIESAENIESGEASAEIFADPSSRHPEVLARHPEFISGSPVSDNELTESADNVVQVADKVSVSIPLNQPINPPSHQDVVNEFDDLKEKVANGMISPHDTVDEILKLKHSIE